MNIHLQHLKEKLIELKAKKSYYAERCNRAWIFSDKNDEAQYAYYKIKVEELTELIREMEKDA